MVRRSSLSLSQTKRFKLDASDLDHRVTIQRVSSTTSVYNEPVNTWSDLVTVSAKRIDATAGETVRAAEVQAQITAHFVVRYSAIMVTVTPADRLILQNGPTYNITGIRELERNRWLEIHCAAIQ